MSSKQVRTCRACAATFEAFPSRTRYKGAEAAIYCSRACASAGRKDATHARFWSRVDRSGPVVSAALGQCWTWTGQLRANGYGRASYYGHCTGAHRVAWQLTHGPLMSSDVVVCHRCDNPSCVRPDHLFIGSSGDNVRDMVAKGRARVPHGEDSPKAKLTVAEVRSIRSRLSAGASRAALAGQHGVTITTIHRIARNEAWRRA